MKKLLFPVLMALLGAAAPVHAQTVGSLMGHVYDQTGTPLRGVKVTASSPTQIGGARSMETNEEGLFRFVGLSPGIFRIEASAPKLKKVIQENVRVIPVQTTEIDLVMEVETAQEEVVIIERPPVIDTNRASVGENFDADFINLLPLQTRDYQGVMALTPGARDTSGTGNPSVRGGTFFNNSYKVDGFETTDPVTHTFSQNFSFDAMANVEVTTAAFGAEQSGTTGGITNIVTKSGSNRLEVDGTLAYSDSNLEFFRDARDIGTRRLVDASVNVGGPLLKDRLWYYFSTNFISNQFQLPKDPEFSEHPAFSVLGFNGSGKLTFQLTPRNKIEVKGSVSPGAFNNILQSYLVEPEAEARQFQRTEHINVQWQARPSDNTLLLTRAGYTQQGFEIGPQSCQWDDANCTNIPGQIDILTGVSRQNFTSRSRENRKRVELGASLEWFKDSARFGSHAAKFGAKFDSVSNEIARTMPGDFALLTLGTEPFRRIDACSVDPKLRDGECRQNWQVSDVSGRAFMAFAQDSWKPTRYLTFTLGAAFHQSRSADDKDTQVTDIITATPHVDVIWDPTRDGKTKLRASFHNNVDTGFLALARFTSRRLYQKSCDWDPEAKAYVRNCRSSGGESGATVGLPCGPEGFDVNGRRCVGELSAPRTWEYSAGAEREVFTGVAAKVDFIYRKFVHQWEDVETNANWSEGGVGLRREANFKTGRAEFIYDLQTPNEAQRQYRAVTAQLTKREGLLRAIVAYTWSKYDGVEDSSYATAFLDTPGQTAYYYGPLPGDIRHDVRVFGSYFVRPWLSVGVRYNFETGGPYNRFHFDPITGTFSRFQASRGYDSRGTLDPDDDIELRLPDISQLDFQVRFNLKPLIKKDLEAWVDVLNVLALRTTTAVIEQDGMFWSRPASRLPPTSARLGLRYRFF